MQLLLKMMRCKEYDQKCIHADNWCFLLCKERQKKINCTSQQCQLASGKHSALTRVCSCRLACAHPGTAGPANQLRGLNATVLNDLYGVATYKSNLSMLIYAVFTYINF